MQMKNALRRFLFRAIPVVSILALSSCANAAAPDDAQIRKVFENNRDCFVQMSKYLSAHPELEYPVREGTLADPASPLAQCVKSVHVLYIDNLNDSVLEEQENGDNGTYREGRYMPVIRYMIYQMPTLMSRPWEHKGIAYIENDSKVKPVPNTDDYDSRKSGHKRLSKYRTIYSKIENHWYIYYETSMS